MISSVGAEISVIKDTKMITTKTYTSIHTKRERDYSGFFHGRGQKRVGDGITKNMAFHRNGSDFRMLRSPLKRQERNEMHFNRNISGGKAKYGKKRKGKSTKHCSACE